MKFDIVEKDLHTREQVVIIGNDEIPLSVIRYFLICILIATLASFCFDMGRYIQLELNRQTLWLAHNSNCTLDNIQGKIFWNCDQKDNGSYAPMIKYEKNNEYLYDKFTESNGTR